MKIMGNFKLSDDMYNALKWWALDGLPLIGTFYFALCTIWGLPFGEQVVGTLTAIDALLAGVIGLAKKNYDRDTNDKAV